MPEVTEFEPRIRGEENLPPVRLALDEYECIRLIDGEGMNQEECARQMGVARTTVQAVYNTARRKIAVFLTEGRELVIRGGCYRLCDEDNFCGKPCARRRRREGSRREEGGRGNCPSGRFERRKG